MSWSFFAHFNRVNMARKKDEVWTVHFRGACIQCKGIVFKTGVVTRYVPDGPQPRATLRGFATRVDIDALGYAVVE